MSIVDAEIARVKTVPPGSRPNYNQNNPIWKLVRAPEAARLQADREHYIAESLQHLFGLDGLALIGPSGNAWEVKDPRLQDNKEDFQKQNLYEFTLNGTELSRGYASAGNWTGSFLRIAYTPRAPLVGAERRIPRRIRPALPEGRERRHRYQLSDCAVQSGERAL